MSFGSWFMTEFLFLTLWMRSSESLRCDANFNKSVTLCLEPLEHFPRVYRERLFTIDDYNRTEIICNWGLVRTSSECLAKLYAKCPRVKSLRAECRLSALHHDPGLLANFSEIICGNLKDLEKDKMCLRNRECSFQNCMKNFDPFVPSKLTTGMFKEPAFKLQCMYFAHAEKCYMESLVGHCLKSTIDVIMKLLVLHRPKSCSVVDIEAIYRYKGWDAEFINASASKEIGRTLVLCLSLVTSVCIGRMFFGVRS